MTCLQDCARKWNAASASQCLSHTWQRQRPSTDDSAFDSTNPLLHTDDGANKLMSSSKDTDEAAVTAKLSAVMLSITLAVRKTSTSVTALTHFQQRCLTHAPPETERTLRQPVRGRGRHNWDGQFADRRTTEDTIKDKVTVRIHGKNIVFASTECNAATR